MKHIHSELIKAWADGAKVQERHLLDDEWYDTDQPCWSPDTSYRIKPTPRKRQVLYSWMTRNGDIAFAVSYSRYATIEDFMVDYSSSNKFERFLDNYEQSTD